MATEPSNQPSFSRGRRWSIGFNVVFIIAVALAIVVMLNYLASQYFRRVYVSTAAHELAPRTLNVLNSLTNQVQITIYYDKDDQLYGDIANLLREYHAQNPKVAVTTVDYIRDLGAAQELKVKYNLGATTNKNFIIFDCAGRTKIIPGSLLPGYDYPMARDQPDPTKPVYDKKLVSFSGEMLFTPALFAVCNPKPLKAYFLQGHGEKSFEDADDIEAYFKFAEILRQNSITNAALTLLGTNAVPMDCNLLVIAGPRDMIPDGELEKIEQYLNQGGRLLALFNVHSVDRNTGLEKILAKWGVDVSHNIIRDPKYSVGGQDVIIPGATLTQHPVTRPLSDSALQILLPRAISRIEPPTAHASDVPQVTELATTSPQSILMNEPATAPRAYPIMVAVEKSAIKGVATERGTTRMLIAGDSMLIDNELIESGGNRDFANSAINWLLERTVLLEGLGPRRVVEYRLLLNKGQTQAVKWVLLGAMPGAVLLMGGLVWFRRRK